MFPALFKKKTTQTLDQYIYENVKHIHFLAYFHKNAQKSSYIYFLYTHYSCLHFVNCKLFNFFYSLNKMLNF